MAVKKALVAVTACLQDWPPMGKPLTLLNGLIEKADYRDSPNLHTQFFPRLPLESPLIGNSENASAFHSSWAYADTKGSLDTKGRKQEVAFRLLVSDPAAAGIIGRRGAIVKSLQNVSGALISFAAPLTKSHERVVTISALEVSILTQILEACILFSCYKCFLFSHSHTHMDGYTCMYTQQLHNPCY